MRLVAPLAIALGFFLAGFSARGLVHEAQAQTRPTYRVIGAMKDSTMEKELGEAVAQGCEPLIGIGGAAGYGMAIESMLVLKCP